MLKRIPIFFVFAISIVPTNLCSMDDDSSDSIITLYSEEEDIAPARTANIPLSPALFEPTKKSEALKHDTFEALFTNNQLLQYLTYPEAHALCSTSKECLKHCKRYLEEQITGFTTKYTANTQDSSFLKIRNDKSLIFIDPKTVSFDLSGNYAYGIGNNSADDNPTKDFYYFFSYPAKIIHKQCNLADAKLCTKINLRGSLARIKTTALTEVDSAHTEQNIMCVDIPVISFTPLSSFIRKIPDCSNLIAIDLSHNGLQSVQLGLFNLCIKLEFLNLSHNKLTDLDTKNAGCTSHISLILHHNQLSDKLFLKKIAATYVCLNTVDLSHNAFQEIEFPEYNSTLPLLGEARKPCFIDLKNLSLAHNQLTHLNLDTLLRISISDALERVDISGNPITTITPPTSQRQHTPRIHCENIPAQGLALLEKHAVSTKKIKPFWPLLGAGTAGGMITVATVSSLNSHFSDLPPGIQIGLILGLMGAGMLCGASTSILLRLCCRQYEELFHHHYTLTVNNQQKSCSDNDEDSVELTEANFE